MEKLTCCFTGHRPEKLPWGEDERDPRCMDLKCSLEREVEELYLRGFCRFIGGMARGADLYFAEAVLVVKEKYPPIILEAAVPFRGQADRWNRTDQIRYREVLAQCDRVNVLYERYTKDCMHARDRYMVDRSHAILAVYDGSPGGTRYTMNYAGRRGLEILILNADRPGAAAVRLIPPEK